MSYVNNFSINLINFCQLLRTFNKFLVKMREIVHIQLGQAGNNIGNKVR